MDNQNKYPPIVLPDNFSTNDLLGFSDYSSVLSEVILTSDTPITLGVFGRWGSGKTSLLQIIKEGLDADNQTIHCTVWFNAWKYEQHDALWRAFILRVLDSMRPSDKSGKPIEQEKLSKQQKKIIEELNRLEDNLYQPIEWKDVGDWVVDWTKAIPATINAASNIALSFAPGGKPLMDILGKAYKGVTGEEDVTVADAFHRRVQEYRREQLRSVEQFEKLFSDLLKKHFVSKNKRLVVFIDDLDRCLPEKTIQILEAIKLFLDVEGCVFVCALDRDVIEKALGQKYQPNNNQLTFEINGEEYLEKMIQVPFYLPPIDRKNISKFLSSVGSDLPYSVISVFSNGIQSNPRKLKRAVNLYKVLKRIAVIRFNNNPDWVQDTLLAKMVTIQMRSKDLFREICNYPYLLPALENYFKSKSLVLDENPGEQIRRSIWDKYTTSTDYIYLADLLTWGEIPQDYFSQLPLEELEKYLYLSSSLYTGEDESRNSQDDRIIAEILEGDPIKIQSLIEKIKSSKNVAVIKRRLDKNLINKFDITKAFSSGIALGYLDYPSDLDATCEVPGGEYTIVVNGELKKIQVNTFKMAKYPVTNRQFKEFINAGGYNEKVFWSDDGWKIKQREGWMQPKYWGNPKFNQPNQPVVGVSLHECLAFANWSSRKLPTGEQWQIAAAGKDGLLYPWGYEFQKLKSNTVELNIQCTSPVNMFIDNSSEFGVVDMSGNVWEWTLQEHSLGGYIIYGGSWSDEYSLATSRSSFRESSDRRENNLGFRLCD